MPGSRLLGFLVDVVFGEVVELTVIKSLFLNSFTHQSNSLLLTEALGIMSRCTVAYPLVVLDALGRRNQSSVRRLGGSSLRERLLTLR